MCDHDGRRTQLTVKNTTSGEWSLCPWCDRPHCPRCRAALPQATARYCAACGHRFAPQEES